jgi:hypothetical protein
VPLGAALAPDDVAGEDRLSAELDEFLAMEADGAGTPVTASQIDLALIEEFHGSGLTDKGKGGTATPFPLPVPFIWPGAGVWL